MRARAALLGLLLVGLPRSVPAQNETLPPGFSLEQVAFGPFEPGRPVGFTFLPDGRILIVERNTGHVRVQPVGSATSPVVHTVPDVTIDEGRGLVGIAVDPDWPVRPYLYVHYSHVSSRLRVSMYTASGDLEDPASSELSFASPFHILDAPDESSLHNGGTLRFGPDKMLYVSFGDDGDPCSAQNPGSMLGSILRLDVSGLPAGSARPAGPHLVGSYPLDDAWEARLIYAHGLRNPFRFTVDSPTGDLFIGDVGEMAFEEVDHLSRDSGPRPRPNFGWPRREGFANSGLGLECGKRNAFTDPIWTYPNPGDAVTVIVGPRYRGTPGSEFSFPAEYEGSLFVMDFFHGWIRRLVQTATGWELAAPVEGQPSSENWGASFLFYSDFQLGPDGALYLARLIPRPSRPSGIYRVVPSVADRSIASAASSSDVRAGPNPVVGSSGTDIRWEVVHPGPHTLAIHDAAGRRLRVVEISLLSRGPASVRWDGRTGRGDPAPAGVYFYSVRDAAGQQRGGKLLLLR